MSSSLGHFIKCRRRLGKQGINRLGKQGINRTQPGELKPHVQLRNLYLKKSQSLHIVEILELILH